MRRNDTSSVSSVGFSKTTLYAYSTGSSPVQVLNLPRDVWQVLFEDNNKDIAVKYDQGMETLEKLEPNSTALQCSQTWHILGTSLNIHLFMFAIKECSLFFM